MIMIVNRPRVPGTHASLPFAKHKLRCNGSAGAPQQGSSLPLRGSEDPCTSSDARGTSRRVAVHLCTAALLWTAAAPSRSAALAPVEAPPGDVLGRLARALPVPLPPALVQPDAVRFPRKALDLSFAVLLMRSSYDAVDALDFIPMERFEANFWKLRQSEVEAYNALYSPVRPRQGDLTDPLYFDFISFSQYATISREMQRAQMVFEERQDDCSGVGPDDACPSVKRVVRRPPQLADNGSLPGAFSNLVGDMIYGGLRDGFRGKVFTGTPPPPPPGATIDDIASGVRALLGVMDAAGYALTSSVSVAAGAGSAAAGPRHVGDVRVDVTGSANLWAVAALAVRQAWVSNQYDAMVVDAWLRAGGLRGECTVALTDSGGLEEQWRVWQA